MRLRVRLILNPWGRPVYGLQRKLWILPFWRTINSFETEEEALHQGSRLKNNPVVEIV